MKREKTERKYWNMQNDLRKKVDSGNLENLTKASFRSVCAVGMELLKKHVASTVLKEVADYFKALGFMVTMDFDNVNYVIVEV